MPYPGYHPAPPPNVGQMPLSGMDEVNTASNFPLRNRTGEVHQLMQANIARQEQRQRRRKERMTKATLQAAAAKAKGCSNLQQLLLPAS